MDLCHLKNSELESRYQQHKGRAVLREDIVKDDSGSYAVFIEQRSSASQMLVAKVMDVISRLPRFSGQASDAVSAHTQVKMEDASTLSPNSKVRMSSYLDTSTKAQMVKIMNQHGRPSRSSWAKSVRSSFDRTIMIKSTWESSIGKRLVKSSGVFLCQSSKRTIPISVCGRNQTDRTNRKQIRLGKFSWKDIDLGESVSFLDHVYFGCTQRECKISNEIVTNYRVTFQSRISAEVKEKLPVRASGKPDAETIASWCYDMEGHAKKCVERNYELSNITTQQSYDVVTSCMDDHPFKEDQNESVGEKSTVWSQIVLTCLYLARIGRTGILLSVNKLARAVTKWTKSCDKRSARSISHIHHTSESRQYCCVGNTTQQCRLILFQDSDFAGDFEDSKSTTGGVLRIFGSHTFVPTSWMCKKQTSVSHSLQKLKSFLSM